MAKKQKAGDNSVNYQADKMTINEGLTIDNAISIAQSLFEKKVNDYLASIQANPSD